MTTIAYRHPIIAYDSRKTNDRVIISDNVDKKLVRGDLTFFCSGPVSDHIRLVDAVETGKVVTPCDSYALLVRPGGVVSLVQIEGDRLVEVPVDQDQVYAIGSGCDFAFAAMDMGATAVKAVEQALKRDLYSGGVVRSFNVATNENT